MTIMVNMTMWMMMMDGDDDDGWCWCWWWWWWWWMISPPKRTSSWPVAFEAEHRFFTRRVTEMFILALRLVFSRPSAESLFPNGLRRFLANRYQERHLLAWPPSGKVDAAFVFNGFQQFREVRLPRYYLPGICCTYFGSTLAKVMSYMSHTCLNICLYLMSIYVYIC